MPVYLDTSALAKLYHRESGTAQMEEILLKSGTVFLSRLGVLEMHSVLSGKVRAKVVSHADSELARRQFRSDIRRRVFRVVALHVRHYELAQSLIDTHGASKGLKTLDSLQLAVGLDLKRNGLVDCFVTADKVLVGVAPLEDLKCIDPEAV